MSKTVDYYLAANSPWSYLGHARFQAMAKATGAQVRVKPVDLAGQVFPVSGGLPLPQRAAQRRAYRLVELARFKEVLNVPLNIEPAFFPVNPTPASLLIIATQMQHGQERAMDLTGAVLRAVWAQERNIADSATLLALLKELDLPTTLLEDSQLPDVKAHFQTYTEEAIACGVFGAPSYVIDGEIFWGQDRLDFVQRCLQQT
jgi:2-hydroxychromene-2-carboxylate isomerase